MGLQGVKVALILPLANSSMLSAAIVGTVDIEGNTANVTGAGIEYNCNLMVTSGPCPSSFGNALVENAMGDLTPFFLAGVFLGDLSNAMSPLNQPIDMKNWLTLTATPFNATTSTVALDLTFLLIGSAGQADYSAALAPRQTCAPLSAAVTSCNPLLGLSNVNLANTYSGFTANFDVEGIMRDVLDGSTGTFTGTVTAVVNGRSYQTAVARILAGTVPPFAYTASSFNLSAIPEPSYLLCVAGLALLVCVVAFAASAAQGKIRADSRPVPSRVVWSECFGS
jgi:hypothetical protein